MINQHKIKTVILTTILLLCNIVQAQKNSKQYFVNAKNEIDSMLSGKKPLDYERAVFITENAYHDNYFNYNDFQYKLEFHQAFIQLLKSRIEKHNILQPKKNFLVSADSANKNCDKLYSNYAIFKYLTDTTSFLLPDSLTYIHLPYRYSYNDPLASKHWEHSQVFNLLYANKNTGNCLALNSLFKIFSLRFNSNANITTTQGHIFITHKDENARTYNIELASKLFPGTGSIEILTYTSDKSVRSGITMRELNLKQSVSLCLANLAKCYERKFKTKSDPFIIECAELAIKYDSLNLNAMLTKAQALEEQLLSKNKNYNQLKTTKEFLTYQNYIKYLHCLGYREMPTDMKNKIVSALTKDTTYFALFKDNTYKPHKNINKNYNRTFSMSNGMFEEFDIEQPTRKYFHTVFDTKLKQIIRFEPIDTLYNKYEFDPVVFAWQVDPLAHKFPWQSPYCAFDNDPINKIDPDGRAAVPPDEFDKNGNKISDLGGSDVNFYHQEDGSTIIEDQKTCATNTIKGGENLIKGYTQRDGTASWSTITSEFLKQQGTTKSIFADFTGTSSSGPFQTLHSAFSSYTGPVREISSKSNLLKGVYKMSYKDANPFAATDMWEQMWGRSNVSWYKLGDKTLFMMNDSKSAESLFYRATGNWDRSKWTMLGNTYQTYIWIENNNTIQSKINEKATYWHAQYQKTLEDSKKIGKE